MYSVSTQGVDERMINIHDYYYYYYYYYSYYYILTIVILLTHLEQLHTLHVHCRSHVCLHNQSSSLNGRLVLNL